MKKLIILSVLLLEMIVFTPSVFALAFSFQDIPPDNGINISSSFSGEVVEDQGQVLFTIANNVDSPSDIFIGKVFFEFDPDNLLTFVGFESVNSVGDVYFVPKTGGTLPQGNNLVPTFEFDVQEVAENPGTDKQGIDDGEVGAFRFDGNFADVGDALLSGYLRIGIHVQGIDYGDGSDAYVSKVSPVPEPSSILLIGTGLLGLAGIQRKKWFSRKK